MTAGRIRPPAVAGAFYPASSRVLERAVDELLEGAEGSVAPGEAAFAAHVAAHPKDKHGRHAYGLEAYGLSEEVVLERFADYVARFDVADGSGPGDTSATAD